MSGFPNPPVVPVTGTYATAATIIESAQVVGDTNPRFTIGADGRMQWGPGNGAADTVLYRFGAAQLKTDTTLYAGADFVARHTAGTAVGIGAVGPGSTSGLTFQNGEAGSNLYRAAAGVLKCDNIFQAGANIIANVGLGNEVRIGTSPVTGIALNSGAAAGAAQVAGNTLSYGSGAPVNASGANGDIYFRTDGGAGTTIYQRRAGAWVGIV